MQYEFGFYETMKHRPERPERLFFCLQPDEGTCRQIGWFRDQFIDQNQLVGKRIDLKRLHISLHHVGDFPYLSKTFISAAELSGAAVSRAPIHIEFRAVQSFGGASSTRFTPTVLLAQGRTLSDLFQELGDAMSENGMQVKRHFMPHTTLFYGPQYVPKQPIEPIRFVAREFVLIHSRLGLGKYEVIGRWHLQGR